MLSNKSFFSIKKLSANGFKLLSGFLAVTSTSSVVRAHQNPTASYTIIEGSSDLSQASTDTHLLLTSTMTFDTSTISGTTDFSIDTFTDIDTVSSSDTLDGIFTETQDTSVTTENANSSTEHESSNTDMDESTDITSINSRTTTHILTRLSQTVATTTDDNDTLNHSQTTMQTSSNTDNNSQTQDEDQISSSNITAALITTAAFFFLVCLSCLLVGYLKTKSKSYSNLDEENSDSSSKTFEMFSELPAENTTNFENSTHNSTLEFYKLYAKKN
ncbi:MAG: hypothetical protein Tsb005_05340 [Gammaproteobacteria bacterium]